MCGSQGYRLAIDSDFADGRFSIAPGSFFVNGIFASSFDLTDLTITTKKKKRGEVAAAAAAAAAARPAKRKRDEFEPRESSIGPFSILNRCCGASDCPAETHCTPLVPEM